LEAARLSGQGWSCGSGKERRCHQDAAAPAYRADSTRNEILAFTR
jgi:hypothetical protein